MKTLRFTYRLSLKFDMPVCEHYFTLRCVPVSNDVQEITIEKKYNICYGNTESHSGS